MATTQTVTSITWASGSSTTSGTSNAISTSGSYAATLYGSIVVVGTATSAATVQVQESPDGGTTWYASPTKLFTAGLTAGTYPLEIALEPTTTGFRVVYTAQTGGTSSTFTAQLAQVTAI